MGGIVTQGMNRLAIFAAFVFVGAILIGAF